MKKTDTRNLSEMSEIDSVRKRAGNTFGTNDIDGEIHGIGEIIMNAVDEATEGHGDKINITIEEDNTTTVEDFGRGLPMGWNEELGKYNWEIALCTLHGSGKLDSSQYSRSAGLNGLGLTSMQYASEFMEVTSIYDGQSHYMEFRKGHPVGDMKVEEDNSGRTGTIIRFKPDPEVFIGADKTIPVDAFNTLLRRQAMLIDGLKITLNHCKCGKPIVMYYEKGIVEYVDKVTVNKMSEETPYFEDKRTGVDDERVSPEPYEASMRMAFNFSKSGGVFEGYHNGAHMYESQQNKTVEAVQKSFVKTFEAYGKEIGKFQKADKLLFRDIEPILVCVFETSCPGYRTFFKHQTKGAITNPFIVRELEVFASRSVRSWIQANKKAADKALNEIIALKKAREEADKISKKAVAELTKAVTSMSKPEGLYDCESNNPEECEIYFVEGTSALTSVVTARDDQYQAAIALTGKPINCLKASLTDIINNAVIKRLYRALQCGIQARSKYIKDLPPFDIKKLRYDKIIISADADLDGKHIIILLLAMFYRLSPDLLREGKVYIVESPLFEISYKDITTFAYSDNEKEKVLDKFEEQGIPREKVKVQRSKGLGENTPEMMSETTMSKDTRRLIQVKYPEKEEDLKMLEGYFNAMLGDDIEGRRVLIDQLFSITDDITD